MISAISWVPKGAARKEPKTYEPTEEELEAAKRNLGADDASPEDEDDDEDEDDQSMSEDEDMSGEEGEGKEEAVAKAKAVAEAIAKERTGGAGTSTDKSLEEALAELDMDNYDSEEDEPLGARIMGEGKGRSVVPPEDDEYMNREGDSDDESIQDLEIRDTDMVLIAARNEDDVSHLEVYVYEEETEDEPSNLYVHHDIMLAAFPLCLAWMDLDPTGASDRGNYVAVGTFDPAIEIWDLDMMDALEPVKMLGGVEAEEEDEAMAVDTTGMSAADKKKLKKKKAKAKAKAKAKSRAPTFKEGSHTDAVMSLSWNRTYRNVLASGSADCVVKVWDVVKGTCERSLTHHKGKAQAVAWNPVEATALLTGGYDRVVALADMREGQPEPLKWKVSADVESLLWHPHDPTCFLVSTEEGLVTCFDARKGPSGAPLFRLHAHDKATCSMSFNPVIPGLLATCSTDKKVKLWDLRNHSPSLVAQEDLQVGACFSVGFCPSQPFLVAAGGAKGLVSIWDLLTCGSFAQKYGQEIRTLQQGGVLSGAKVEKAEKVAQEAAAAAPSAEGEGAKKKKKKTKGVKI